MNNMTMGELLEGPREQTLHGCDGSTWLIRIDDSEPFLIGQKLFCGTFNPAWLFESMTALEWMWGRSKATWTFEAGVGDA